MYYLCFFVFYGMKNGVESKKDKSKMNGLGILCAGCNCTIVR